MTAADSRGAIDAIWRIESARLIAGLARIVRDVGRAEDLAQDALVAALEEWPRTGVPDKPGAWLFAAAKHRAIDLLRRDKRLTRKHEELGRASRAGTDAVIDETVPDDVLRLLFAACHPVLPAEQRAALTLRVLGGLTTDEIARAFLVPEPAIAQRIVRAKRALSTIPFDMPKAKDLPARLASVLEVIYLIFNEGYSATAGEDWMRPSLCEEALRVGRILAELAPKEAEVHGLVALMELHASRLAARTSLSGEPVLLADQDRSRWDRLLIGRGLAALERSGAAKGPYALQAAIAACHARAHSVAETDWARIVVLYDELARVAPSPVVDLNRAVAVSMASGPAAGLEAVDALRDDARLRGYHLLFAVRGDLLAKLGRTGEAREDFERAAALATNAQERKLLLRRAETPAPPATKR